MTDLHIHQVAVTISGLSMTKLTRMVTRKWRSKS